MNVTRNPFTKDDGTTDVDRLDRWLDRAQRAGPFIALATLIITIVLLLAVTSRNDDDEAAACRSVVNNEVQAGIADVLTRVSDGLYGVYMSDPALVGEQVKGLPAATKKLNDAVERQRKAAQLGAADPKEFLAACRERSGGP